MRYIDVFKNNDFNMVIIGIFYMSNNDQFKLLMMHHVSMVE